MNNTCIDADLISVTTKTTRIELSESKDLEESIADGPSEFRRSRIFICPGEEIVC